MTCLWVGIVDGQFRVMHQRRGTVPASVCAMVTSRDHRLTRASHRIRCGSRMAVSRSSAESSSTVLEELKARVPTT